MTRRASMATKDLRGTRRRDRLAKPGALDRLESAPAAPAGLSPAAVLEWDWLARTTVDTGVLTRADLRALELLAQALAHESALRAAIAADGMTIPGAGGSRKAHPAIAGLGSCQSRASKMLEGFGLTPASRQTVDVRPRSADADDDGLAEFVPKFDFDN